MTDQTRAQRLLDEHQPETCACTSPPPHNYRCGMPIHPKNRKFCGYCGDHCRNGWNHA